MNTIKLNEKELARQAYVIRKHALEAIKEAGSGHIGGSFSLAEILSVLYFNKLNINPENPKWEDRDRFVLSKGHCTPTTYAALALRGFFPVEDLKCFRKLDGYLSGHIEMVKVPGVDMSGGSLGQGLSVALGMAMSAKTYQKSYKVYAVLGDGEIGEGQIWEAAMSAGRFKLNNLIAILDNNHIQLDGRTDDVMPLGDIRKKFEAFDWHVISICGNDISQILAALEQADEVTDKPILILADTIKGKGVSIFEDDPHWHGAHPSKEQFEIAFAELDKKILEMEA